MAQSLKERYEAKRLTGLRERLQVIDERWDYTDVLILEAFDKQQMAQAQELLKKLNSVDFGSLRTLNAAKDTALNDVRKILGGKGGPGFFKKIINAIKDQEADNPLIKAVTFCEQLDTFFELFPGYIQTELKIPKEEMKPDTTLAELLGGQKAADMTAAGMSGKVEGDAREKLNALTNIVKRGLMPNPYIKDIKAVAKEIANMKLAELDEMAPKIRETLSGAKEVAGSLKKAAQIAGNATGTTSGEVGSGGQAPASSGTAGQGSEKGAEQTTSPTKKGGQKLSDEHVKDMAQHFSKKSGIDQSNVEKVLIALNNDSKLREVLIRHLQQIKS